jgi:hypothetical protein
VRHATGVEDQIILVKSHHDAALGRGIPDLIGVRQPAPPGLPGGHHVHVLGTKARCDGG